MHYAEYQGKAGHGFRFLVLHCIARREAVIQEYQLEAGKSDNNAAHGLP